MKIRNKRTNRKKKYRKKTKHRRTTTMKIIQKMIQLQKSVHLASRDHRPRDRRGQGREVQRQSESAPEKLVAALRVMASLFPPRRLWSRRENAATISTTAKMSLVGYRRQARPFPEWRGGGGGCARSVGGSCGGGVRCVGFSLCCSFLSPSRY